MSATAVSTEYRDNWSGSDLNNDIALITTVKQSNCQHCGNQYREQALTDNIKQTPALPCFCHTDALKQLFKLITYSTEMITYIL